MAVGTGLASVPVFAVRDTLHGGRKGVSTLFDTDESDYRAMYMKKGTDPFSVYGTCYRCRMSKRIALLADVQNIYYTTRQAYGRQFDYRTLWQRISAEGDIVSATAYAIDRGDEKQLQFQNVLRHLGFTVKLKPWIQRSDGSAKGDWDVGITIDALEIAGAVDTVVLLSGDGDFDLLLEKLNTDYGVSTEVYGVPALTAGSLISAASVWHRIEEDLLLQS
jgi:uncharacterized LabA/DUF88 family protein